MKHELNAIEARVLASLIEKEITTPDQYPLSLKSLTAACNQKSSRDPVMSLSEIEVQSSLDDLKKKYLVAEGAGFSGRVTKYRHRLFNSTFGTLEFTSQQVAIICVLMLRGPQSAGELRTRTNRLATFEDTSEVEIVLLQLAEDFDEPFVVRLAREPGKRDERYAHLFSGPVSAPVATGPLQPAPAAAPRAASPANDGRIEALESAVAELREEIAQLRARLPATDEH